MQTIVVISVCEGVVQLGSTEKVQWNIIFQIVNDLC